MRGTTIQILAWTIAAMVTFSASSAIAQETRGAVTGKILDSSGAVIPNATVAANNTATNVTVKATTNQEGVYNLLFLLPGVYGVTASATGFKTVRRDQIELRIHERLQLDFTLEVGAVTEEVRVTAEAPLLEAANANLGQVIDARRISELPIPHGSPYTLLYLTPGVTNTYPGGMTYQEPTNLNATTTLMNVNGAPFGTTDFTVDGVPNTQTSNADRGVGMANSPPADIVQEFKLETAFDASVGHTSGTVINVSLKTGTNQPHGTAYMFHRDPEWNANSFFANRAGQPKGDFTYNRFGASLAGPVYIPKVYNGKDRSFFSYGYEGLRFNSTIAFTGTVPDPKNLTGDFSNLLAVSSQYQIYDPATIRPAPSGRFSVEPFVNNTIPASRINPIAKNIATHYPAPNNTARPDGVNNFTAQNRPEPTNYFNHIGRFDHNISDKQRLYARVSVSRKLDGPYRNFWDDVAVSNLYIGKTRQFTIDDVYTFTPTFVMNVRYGYIRYAGGHFPRRVGFDVTQLGFSQGVANLTDPQLRMFPRVDVAAIRVIGNEGADRLNNDVHSLFVNGNKQHATHNLKFGADLRAYRDNVFTFGQAGGQYIFNTDFTRGPFDNSPTSPGGGVGQGLAAFLLGQPTGGLIDRNDSQAIQSTYWAFYLHDNWRASRKLTVDLGLRWEYEGPVTERFNRAVRGFDPTAAQSIEAAAKGSYAMNPDPAVPVSQFQVRGGLQFAGVGGQPRLFWDRSLHNFAPRFGFAYQAHSRVVVRGGFGTYPIQIGQPLQNRAIQSGFNQNTSLVPTLDNGQNFIANLANPYPNGVLRAPGASLGAATFLGRAINFYNPIARTPYTMRWDLNFQTLLPGQMLLETGYFASRAIKLMADRELDALPNQFLSTSPSRDQNTINYLTQNISNPLQGLLPGTGLNGGTIPRNQLLRPFPQFASVTMRDYQGYSWYNSLQVRLERRFQNGFTALVGYTFSKLIEGTQYLNPADAVPHRVISAADRPHHLAFSGILELPVGRGKPLLPNLGRAANALIGGWQLGSVWHINSGEPIGFGNVLFNGNIKDIALPKDQRNIDRWFNTEAGFERNSARQLDYNLRTFPLRLSGVRSDIYNVWDLSLLKNTRIHERHQFQFRGEFLNALNHPTGFAPPNTSPTSSAFGQVTDQYALPRIVQLGIKYVF